MPVRSNDTTLFHFLSIRLSIGKSAFLFVNIFHIHLIMSLFWYYHKICNAKCEKYWDKYFTAGVFFSIYFKQYSYSKFINDAGKFWNYLLQKDKAQVVSVQFSFCFPFFVCKSKFKSRIILGNFYCIIIKF